MKKLVTIVSFIAIAALMNAGEVLAQQTKQDKIAARHSFTGQQYSKEAKIDIDTARRAALGEFPGKIISEELEHEGGGSGLRYSFDIRRGSVTHEVGVDAVTGKVLENSLEGRKHD
ncbi:MAG: PepSY domain-containing protein [Desulfobacteraceae bacterium]|nr:PepSY domain-containing protein [Desulfobacteraceae bacterium]